MQRKKHYRDKNSLGVPQGSTFEPIIFFISINDSRGAKPNQVDKLAKGSEQQRKRDDGDDDEEIK